MALSAIQKSTECTPLDMLLYYRLRTTCREVHEIYTQEPPSLAALDCVLCSSSPKSLITRLCSTMEAAAAVIMSRAKFEWNADLGIVITDE